MIEYPTGNLLHANVEALVNAVNCVGVMGKGIALQFKQTYPSNFDRYRQACRVGGIQLGQMFTVLVNQTTNPRYVVNFPTKQHWRAKSKLADIERGLTALVREVLRLGIESIAVPALGCGSGGLVWDEVRPMIEGAFVELSHVRVLVFAPQDATATSE